MDRFLVKNHLVSLIRKTNPKIQYKFPFLLNLEIARQGNYKIPKKNVRNVVKLLTH